MQSIDNLSEETKTAYQAFLDMSKSKEAHFSCLETIEAINKSGAIPTNEKSSELEQLLAQHDKNVLAFRNAMVAVTNKEEKRTLLELMS